MNLYNIEIFSPSYAFRGSAQKQEISCEFDYLSIRKNKLELQLQAEVYRGDYIRISKGERKIIGMVTGVSDSDTVTIEYMPMISIFDVNVYADVISIINSEDSLEDWIAATIEKYFVNSEDPLQNIEGLSVKVISNTVGKKKLGYDSNIFNLYELMTMALTQHDVVVDIDINISEKNLIVTIGKRCDDEKYIEADLPNVLEKEFSIEKGNESVNKIIVVNEDRQEEQEAYYLLNDGTVSNAAKNTERISPVIFNTTFISVKDDEVFADKAYNEAAGTLISDEYDNYIRITIENDDSLVKPDEWLIGQKTAIIHKGYVYNTILTGIEIGKRTTLIYGAVRKELTKKLKRRIANGKY